MKMSSMILPFVFSACALVTAQAEPRHEAPQVVNVPAGDLGDAVESLARQMGVDVMYRGGTLSGLRTAGVQGRFEVATAFDRLLKGTPPYG
jgi:hypothetical protein